MLGTVAVQDDNTYDDLVIGTGMAGLTVGALLAKAGRRVLLLEAHEFPGGYAHTFPMGDYRFCAQVHYVFGCGEGEPVHDLLDRLGLTVRRSALRTAALAWGVPAMRPPGPYEGVASGPGCSAPGSIPGEGSLGRAGRRARRAPLGQ